MAARVLIVDDEQTILSIMAECLEDAGYQVHIASSGHEGVGLLKQLQPDLVISDVWMPGMDGYHFARLVRRACDAQILMVTGVPQEAAVLKDMNVDIDGYLVKPFSVRDFLQQVEKLLHQEGSRSPTVEEDHDIKETQSQFVDRLLSSREDQLLEMYRGLTPSDSELVEAMITRLLDAAVQAEHPAREDHVAASDRWSTSIGV